ncbi:cubilin homolog [Scaptodrosophila lebanonensis]|uniref:Cubilin homolog n=1 Tax=Drosophila lebanonensis TaxID=7225 RepID=A0A6J2TJE4_DROLE|nr:cubilin homolog [Scaptodrosophila lebanonensis]
MQVKQPRIGLFPKFFLLLLSLLALQFTAAYDNVENRSKLQANGDGTLVFEPAPDKNLTFRLMGESAKFLLNDVDVLARLEQFRSSAPVQPETQIEPLSLNAFKEQFGAVKRDLDRLAKRLANLRNRKRRNGPNQRVLRRDLQRVQRVTGAVMVLERNLALDECQSMPCKNGGTCYDDYKSFHCDCTAGWQGTTCEEDVNECLDNSGTDLESCMNDGQCINTPGSYRCLCRSGYSGAHCRLQNNICLANQSRELCGHGTCISSTNTEGYVCICDQGWTWASNVSVASSSPCSRDVDECAPDRNPCHDECINFPGSFRCGACPTGYTGDGRFCRDIDECATNNGGCSQRPLVACINTEGSYRCGRCPVGWSGDGHSCVQAKSNLCNGEGVCHPRAQCEYISDTMVCTCPVGFYGHGYGADGCTADASQEPCERHICQNNGTCVLSGRGTSCICQPGYMGPLCEQADACHPNPCQNGGTCKLLPNNKQQCSCSIGYTGTTCANMRQYCGAILLGENGTLQYPSGGENSYQPDERCAFIIRTTPGKVLNVTFQAFDLQPSEDGAECSADFLQLHDGNSLAARVIGRFCGSQLPLGNGSLLSTHELLFFWFRSDNATQARGFNFTWSSLPHVCGEELTLLASSTGVIRSPGYPGKTRPRADCRWQLSAPYGSRIMLRFYDVTLGATGDSDCSKDSLLIYESDRQLLSVCRSAQPAPLLSSTSELRIDFHTDSYQSDSAFQLHYEVVPGLPGCGGTFHEPRGIISGYMNSPMCLYFIEQPDGFQIQLTFNRINFLTSENCHLQKLEVFNGRNTESPLLERYCGQPEDKQTLVSTGNAVLLRYEYELAGLEVNRSFELSYSRVCNSNYTDADGDIIQTPNYPNTYFERTVCTFNIVGPLDSTVQLNITDLSISETVPNMADDDSQDQPIYDESDTNYLDVYLARDEKRRFYKSFSNMVLVASNNQARLVFHGATNNLRRRGLRVKYSFEQNKCGGVLTEPSGHFSKLLHGQYCRWVIESSGSKRLKIDISRTCGGIFNSRFGVIKSPNWPKNYAASQDCIWVMTAPLGSKIELVVRNFTLETTSDLCTDDYLEIRNGDMALSPLIGRYCGQRIPPRIPSFGNRLYVSFHSDSYIQDAGFYMTWQVAETGCGGKLTSHVGAIHSPHSMENNNGAVSCDWQIIVAQGSTVELKLERLLSDDTLCNGQLTIYDGQTTQGPVLPLICNQTERELTIVSTSNRVLVRYNVDHDAVDGIFFVIDYSTNCHVQLDQLNGAIESPNFPENYPPSMNCEWDIRSGGRNNHIHLAFSHLDVERSSPTDCDYDYVEVIDMRNEEQLSQRHLCISDAPITSEGNRLLVRFSSDSSAHAHGFRAEYKRIGCGEHLEGDFGGEFASPNAPYSVDLDCDWVIVAPEGQQIRLILQEIHIETPQRDCSEDVLTVSAAPNTSAVLFRSCQIETSAQTFQSPGNTLYVQFHSGQIRARKYFKASYALVPASCGGYIAASSGFISTPGYHEGRYANNLECIWAVEVPNSYGIRLNFEQFNLTDSPNCRSAFVELRKLEEDGSDVFLEKACDLAKPLIRIVHGSRLRVHFKADVGTWGRFSLHFERQCGGLLSNADGYLKSRLDEDCRWLIAASQGAKVSLIINNLECECPTAGNCTSGLRIFNDEDEVLLYDLCLEHPANILVSTNNVRIMATGINLLAQYTTVENSCGGNITSARGTLTSPNYPGTYPSNIECIWWLETRQGNALELNFEALDIVSSAHCNEDFLELRIGEGGPLLGLYCDNEVPASSLTAQSRVWIKFRSLPGNTANGFKLKWNYVYDNELTESNGTIEGPPTVAVNNDDQPYSWRIYMERGKRIVLNIKEYNTGLLLFDGFDDTALPVALSSPWQFTSSSNVIYLKTTNEDFDAFLLQWHAISSEELVQNATAKSTECDKTYTMSFNSRMLLTSPGYPNGYKPKLNCEWTFIPADVTQHVFVDIYDARLETISQCEADYLRIQSSSNMKDWHKELDICNSTSPDLSPIHTIHGTPYLQLQFKTDETVNRTGFKSEVIAVCGSNLTGSVGTILDKHILRSRLVTPECAWHIEVKPGRSIEISIDYAGDIVNASCPFYGLIYDGLDEHAPLLNGGKFCNQQGFATRSYRTSSSHAYIKYILPRAFRKPQPQLWNLTYREFSECDGEIRLTSLASTYNISTPGYPFVPHPHSECSWVVIAPQGETITARFVDRFELNVRQCNEEYVELYDGSTMLAKRILRTCRKPVGDVSIRSTGNVLLVHYLTNIVEPRGGFRLNVSISSCGGEYTGSLGIITSEHYPALGAYPTPAICEYSIKTNRNTRIQLNFTDLHLPYNNTAGPNATDRIEIVDLTNMDEPLMVLYGNGSALPPVFTLNSNEIVLRFITVKAVNTYRGFKLQYSRLYDICYHNVKAPSGTLSITPRQHMSLSTAAICRWRIEVPKGQRVRLEYLNLAEIPRAVRNVTRPLLYFSLMRPTQQFTFFNDDTEMSKITEFNLANYTGNGTIDSTDNFMLVKMSLARISLDGITLRARFSSVQTSPCPPNIDDQSTGMISINALTIFQSYFCQIMFVAGPDETLTFTVQEYLFQTKGGPAVKFLDGHTPIKLMNQNMTSGRVSVSASKGRLTLVSNDIVQLKQFQATYQRHACGAQLQLTDGTVVEQPRLINDLDSDYGELECVWTLNPQYESGDYTLSGNVSLSDSCDREYLVAYTGMRAYATELFRLCRGMGQLDNLAPLKAMPITLLYHATSYQPGQSQFSLVARTSEGSRNIRVMMRPTKPIQIDALSYKNNMERSWEFTVDRGLSIVLEFQGRFFIEESQHCSHDQLQVLSFQAGLWRTQATFCGRETPPKMSIQAERMRVVFRTNANITGDGFSFVVSSSCDVVLHPTAQLQKYAGLRLDRRMYGRMLSCTYDFLSNAPDQQILVRVTFKSRRPRKSTACTNAIAAYKDVYDKKELIDRFCQDFEVSGYQRVHLHYTSGMKRPFEIEYQMLSCGGNFSGPFELRPPQDEVAATYAHDMHCEWRVTAPPEHAVLVRFKYFHIEESRDCQLDYVNIYKGALKTDDQRVSRLCGNLTVSPPTVIVDSRQALIVARSDSSISFKGFAASVRFIQNCNERLALYEGTEQMSLVRNFVVNTTEELICYFTVTAPAGYRINVELRHLLLNDDSCATCNYLEIIDSVVAESNSMGKYYRLERNRTTFFSSYEDVMIKLSGQQAGHLHFELNLQMERTVCGETQYEVGWNDTIKLNMWPGNSTRSVGNIHCTWNFKSSEELEIVFKSMRLSEALQSSGKCIEYLLVTGVYISKYFCGHFNNSKLIIPNIDNASFNLTFHTDDLESDELNGFEVEVRQRPICNQTFTALSDYIVYGALKSSKSNCTDDIRVPSGYTLTIDIISVIFTDWSANNLFTVIDLQTNRTIFNVTQAHYISTARFTSTNALRISTLNAYAIGFLYYATPVGECGGNLTIFEGELTNPPYDNRDHSICNWRLSGPAGNIFTFSFFALDMGSEINCNLDNIKFYQILRDGTNKLIKTLCGSNMQQTFTVDSNRVLIVAKKSPNFDGTGFRFHYHVSNPYMGTRSPTEYV